MNDFPWSYIWILVNLGLIGLVLRKLLAKPLGAFLEGRREGIAESFQQAEEAEAAGTQVLADAESKLVGFGHERDELLAQARERMQALSQQASEQARREADLVLERARTGVGRERDLAVKDLWANASGRTIAATRFVLARVSGPADQEKLVSELLSGIGEVEL